MVVWQGHLQSFVRQVINRHERCRNAPFSTFIQTKASLVSGDVPSLSSLRNSLCPSFSTAVYLYLQKLEFTSSRSLLAVSSETPISSPLIPAQPASTGTGSTESHKAVSKPSKVQTVLKDIKQSPKKVNPVDVSFRGMLVKDALLQLQATVKRAAKMVYQAIFLFRAQAIPK